MSNTKDEAKLNEKEEKLLARKEKLDELEREIKAREKELKAKDAKRKQIVLRLPESLWQDVARWAEDDFRSINGQIEYILTRSVKEHYKK
jgi:hypothetical protein